MLGIPPEDTAIDWNQVIFKGLTLKGIYGREMFETWYKMSAMLQSGLRAPRLREQRTSSLLCSLIRPRHDNPNRTPTPRRSCGHAPGRLLCTFTLTLRAPEKFPSANFS
jgi:hypothetical protein